ncbi:MAG: cation:proton antiporter [Candidatus Peribacteria bacterium]|nr:MAG: cation:proton antiporter [Candidatus Peribacteria bacterium]
MGILFSKILGSIRYNEEAEVTITMISAHATFLLAELITYFSHFTPLSGVIATVTCSIIIGNYGKYKITPRVEQHMQRFWEFFAFIANTVVFILMGITLSYLEVDMMYFVPFIVISIIVVAIARAGSVYGVVGILNKFAKGDERIPMTWQHLLSWGSLR